MIVTASAPRTYVCHSAKGSTWEKHKYIKRIDGTYYYPDSYEGGRHLPNGDKSSKESGSKYGEYSKGDPDFDDKNFDEKNRLGDTDFFGFTRPDGTVVILEEDMKWELPKGTKLTKALIKRLETFSKKAEGRTYKSNEEWREAAKKAIDGNKKKSSEETTDEGIPEIGTLTEADIDALANEVIRGNFGNGQVRKELFGEYYQQVQNRVNEKMKGSKTSSKSTKTEEKKEEKKTTSKSSSSNTKSIDMEKVFEVYRKKEKEAKHSFEELGGEYLAHYGIKKRSGRYPWGSGDRPYQSGETPSSYKKYNKRAAKLKKIDRKYEKTQKKANKELRKAEKKQFSFLEDKERTKTAFEVAKNTQSRANEYARKGAKYYERMERKFGKMGITMDSATAKLGQKYINLVAENTRMFYTQSNAQDIKRRYK